MQSGILSLTNIIGIAAFAFAGILAADGKKLDPVGVFVMAFTTAFGGGLVRDIIIDNRPFFWVAHSGYVWLTIFIAAFAPSLLKHFREFLPYSVFIWSDAVGLGFFSAGGTALSLQAGLPPLPAAILGVCTGAFGGMIRDVFLNQMPMVLSDKQPYASAAFLGCWIYIALVYFGADDAFSLILSSLLIVAVRMLCWYKGWNIIRYRDGDEPKKATDQKPAVTKTGSRPDPSG